MGILLSPKAAGSVESKKAAENKLIIHKEGSLTWKHFRLIRYQETAFFCYKKEIIRLQESQHRINLLLSKFGAFKEFQGEVKWQPCLYAIFITSLSYTVSKLPLKTIILLWTKDVATFVGQE